MLSAMARIRIVDTWLRCPAAAPSHRRAIMVIAESWSEQRVLMRAYASSPDQTRPTIVLHGRQFAISPAGLDPHGPWGIHVEPPADGRAQQFRAELETAAKRLAGSRGSPPRLADEESSFERKRTNHWAPGTPRDLPTNATVEPRYFEPNAIPESAPSPARADHRERAAVAPSPAAPNPAAAPPPAPPISSMPAPMPAPRQAASWPAAVPRAAPNAPTIHVDAGARPHPTPDAYPRPLPAPARPRPAPTAHGFATSPRPGRRIPRAPTPRPTPRPLGKLIRRTVPIGFQLTSAELTVLDALDSGAPLTAARVAELSGAADGDRWMQQLIHKLAEHGIDLVTTHIEAGGVTVYSLKR